jgi:hypothetical protein
MNLLNLIPIVGWAVAAAICFFIAIPLYFLWNWLAPTYFAFLPAVYLDLPFWDLVGLLWLLSSLRGIVFPSVSSSSSSSKG